jgi:hypothetical protein
VWHHHDPDRGGESYLEVVGLDVIEEGRALSQPIAWWPLLAGLGFFGAAITLRVRSSTGES